VKVSGIPPESVGGIRPTANGNGMPALGTPAPQIRPKWRISFMDIYTNGSGPASAAYTTVRVRPGRLVTQPHFDKRQRAALIATLTAGPQAARLSVQLWCRLLGVSHTYVYGARRLSPEQRGAILSGRDRTTRFAELLRPPEPAQRELFTDGELADLARACGADRWLNAAVHAAL
jgi:hypothetical protein